MTESVSGARPSVLHLAIQDRLALQAAYVPVFSDGGLFVPTQRPYRLGEAVHLLVSLPDDPRRHALAGRVGWVNPPRTSAQRRPGIGVRFPADDAARRLRHQIEEILGPAVRADRSCETL
jgi:type IV pilus assembly protein PilZ